MITTCAMVLINQEGDILACHGTGKPKNYGYDFPKGCVDDENESHFEAACRELKEETGLTIEQLDSEGLRASDYIIDGGVYKHNVKKNIHLFLCPLTKFPNLETLECTTFFQTKQGKSLPEMDGYKIITKEERNLFNKVLWNKFEIIDDLNAKFEYKNRKNV